MERHNIIPYLTYPNCFPTLHLCRPETDNITTGDVIQGGDHQSQVAAWPGVCRWLPRPPRSAATRTRWSAAAWWATQSTPAEMTAPSRWTAKACNEGYPKVRKDFTIREKAPTRAWLKVPTSAFTFRTLLRHYAKQTLTPRSLNVKLGLQRKCHKGRAVW